MKSAQRLKEELLLNTELTELLDVLKGIASSEFHTLEKRKERFTKFTEAFEGFFQMIDFSAIDHPFAKGEGRLGIIMITSDEGFMGGLNTQVINTALSQPGAKEAELIIVGERGASYLKGLGYRFTTLEDKPLREEATSPVDNYEKSLRLKDYIMRQGLSGKLGRLILAYPRPISFTIQRVEVIRILPCSALFEREGYGDRRAESRTLYPKNIIVESSLGSIIEYLLEAWITQKLFEVFEDSKLAEFSARTVHLERSHQLLRQRGKQLRFQYFRSHHELVDRGMRESFSAQIIRNKQFHN